VTHQTFVIRHVSEPPLYIAEARGNAYDITYQISKAQRFMCLEDAKHEMLRLGLPAGAWTPWPKAVA
jgi:hypothetical protein